MLINETWKHKSPLTQRRNWNYLYQNKYHNMLKVPYTFVLKSNNKQETSKCIWKSVHHKMYRNNQTKNNNKKINNMEFIISKEVFVKICIIYFFLIFSNWPIISIFLIFFKLAKYIPLLNIFKLATNLNLDFFLLIL